MAARGLFGLAPHRHRHRDIRRVRIDGHLEARGVDDQIHVFHRDRSEQYLIAQNERPANRMTAQEFDTHRRHVRNLMRLAVGENHFAGLERSQLQRLTCGSNHRLQATRMKPRAPGPGR